METNPLAVGRLPITWTDQEDHMDTAKLLSLTTEIVSSHASANALTQDDLLNEIGQVFVKLASLAGVEGAEYRVAATPAEEELQPAVPLEAAFGADKVFCMICGQGMKTLKRHLATSHDLKPGPYRKMFGIPAGTPLVAKRYSEARKAMAQERNLGAKLVEARAARAAKKKPKAPRKKASPKTAKKA